MFIFKWKIFTLRKNIFLFIETRKKPIRNIVQFKSENQSLLESVEALKTQSDLGFL